MSARGSAHLFFYFAPFLFRARRPRSQSCSALRVCFVAIFVLYVFFLSAPTLFPASCSVDFLTCVRQSPIRMSFIPKGLPPALLYSCPNHRGVVLTPFTGSADYLWKSRIRRSCALLFFLPSIFLNERLVLPPFQCFLFCSFCLCSAFAYLIRLRRCPRIVGPFVPTESTPPPSAEESPTFFPPPFFR